MTTGERTSLTSSGVALRAAAIPDISRFQPSVSCLRRLRPVGVSV